MRSRMLANLEEKLNTTSNQSEIYQIKTKMAAHYGKLGEVERARSLIGAIRAERRAMVDPAVVSLLNLAEGLIEFRSGDSVRGVDKWIRARALASSVNFNEGASVAAAWLAFAAYLREDLAGVEYYLKAALIEGYPSHSQAISRSAMILALYFHYCDDLTHARRYYGVSHRSSTECGDEVEISALMHNMSALLIHQKRVASLQEFAGLTPSSVSRTNLASADNYEELIGVKSLRSLSPQLGAYEAVLEQRWSDAVGLISRAVDLAKDDGYSRLIPALLSERALCFRMLNDHQGAERDIALSLEAHSSYALHRDDKAIYYSRLSQVYRLTGDAEEAARYAELARASWGTVRQFQRDIESIVWRINEVFETLTKCQN